MKKQPYFELIHEGVPMALARPRAHHKGHKLVFYDQRNSAIRKQEIAYAVKAKMNRDQILKTEKPVEIDIIFQFTPPESWNNAKREKAIKNNLVKASVPDLSNLVKLVEDALNATIYRDDAQITRITAKKQYGDDNFTSIKIFEK